MNIAKQAVLQELQNKVTYAASSFKRSRHLTNFNYNDQYVRGIQFQNEELNEQIKDMGAIPFMVNKLDITVNKYLSLISRSLKRIGYSPATNSEYDKISAEKLKHWAMSVQTQNRAADSSQLKQYDMLVGGLGWSHFYYENGKFYIKHLSPRNVLPDPDDDTDRMENQNFCACVNYVDVDSLIIKYPQHKKYLQELVNRDSTICNDTINGFATRTKGAYSSLDIIDTDIIDGIWTRGKSVRIVEVFYKKPTTYYECVGLVDVYNQDEMQQAGNTERLREFTEIIFTTFDKEFAEQKAIKGKIKKKIGTAIYKGEYTDNLLLAHGRIDEQVPNQKYLPIVPTVYKRDSAGVPFGIIDNLIPIQDITNLVMTTFMHYKDAKTIIGGDPHSNQEKFAAIVCDQLKQKVGAVFAADASKMTIIDNSKTLPHNLSLMRQIDIYWQEIAALYDEYSGQINRETSGAAIQELTLNTMNVHKNSIINAYERMLVSEGILMLDTLKGVKDLKQLVRFYKLGKHESMQLNSDIALLDMEVFPDSAPNYASSAEEEKVITSSIFRSPDPDFFLCSALRMTSIGLSDETAYKLSEDYWAIKIQEQKVAMEAQLQMEQQQLAMQQQQGANNGRK